MSKFKIWAIPVVEAQFNQFGVRSPLKIIVSKVFL